MEVAAAVIDCRRLAQPSPAGNCLQHVRWQENRFLAVTAEQPLRKLGSQTNETSADYVNVVTLLNMDNERLEIVRGEVSTYNTAYVGWMDTFEGDRRGRGLSYLPDLLS